MEFQYFDVIFNLDHPVYDHQSWLFLTGNYIVVRVDPIYFATSNENKLREAEEILGIQLKGTSLEIEEIQSMDPEHVALQKARAYYARLEHPLFVEDLGLMFNGLNGLPGPYINDFLKTIGNAGLVRLLNDHKDRSAYAKTVIVYIGADKVEHAFIGKVDGEIAEEPKGDKGWGWDPIFIPKGKTRTFGEMEPKEKHGYSMRAKALYEMKEWLDKNG